MAPHHRPIQAVIFDYGGVLAQTHHREPRALWERRLGLKPGALTPLVHDPQRWIAAQRGEITADDHWQAVGTALGLSTSDVAALRATFYSGDVVNQALVSRIEQLRETGFHLGLLSNFSMDLPTLLQQQDLERHFDHIVISAQIGVMKPAAATYEAILALLELAPEQCIFIDDLPVNVAAAQALGLHGIVFRDNASCLATLDRLLAGIT